jgi:flavin reductase (DIM6/NTAB) family NADH-FMN oxidoreductase RutF
MSATAPSPAFHARDFRRSVGQFVTGVTVVSYRAEGEPRGATVNSFTSVSLDPPLVLVSLARTSRAATGLLGVAFTVNVLARDQMDLALHFAGRPQAGLVVRWSQHHAVPRLRGSAAWIECRPHRRIAAGDHFLFLGEVTTHTRLDKDPLLFRGGEFRACGDVLGPSVPTRPPEIHPGSLAADGFPRSRHDSEE